MRGSGGLAAFFRHPARTGVAVASVLMASAAFCSDANLSSGEREDRSNRWILLPLLSIGLLSGFLPAYTERKGWWILDGDTVRWLGFSLYVSGGALRIAPVFVLGRRFSGLVAIQPGHELVTDGIYGRVRHPSYLGLLIMGLGWALTFRSGAGVVLAGLVIPPATCTHSVRRSSIALTVWRGIRQLPPSHIAAHSRHLLKLSSEPRSANTIRRLQDRTTVRRSSSKRVFIVWHHT